MTLLSRWSRALHRRHPEPGFSFQHSGRDEVVYVQGDRRLRINAELQTGETSRVIYASSLRRWQPPHEAEPVSAPERALILQRLRRYYDKRGITYEVE